MEKDKARILVIVSQEKLGKSLCSLLAQIPDITLLIAGHENEALIHAIKQDKPLAAIQSCSLDWSQADFKQQLKETQANILIHSATFLDSDYTLANICIDLNIHYVDLSIHCDFVTQITQCDARAKENNVIVVSGAGATPGLSMAVVDAFAPKFGILREIDVGLSDASIARRLTHMQTPFQRLEKGEKKVVHGWRKLQKYYYGDNLGMRWHANADIPDLVLLPQRYPSLKTVVFHAGLENLFKHCLLWSGIKPHWFFADPLEKIGMYVQLSGSNLAYQPLDINWMIVAEKGDGHVLSTMGCVLVVKKILQHKLEAGARPCVGLFTLDEFNEAIAAKEVYYTIYETEM